MTAKQNIKADAAQPPSPLRYERVFVTPDKAAEFLRTNSNNRPVRKNKLSQFTADMAAGRWRETGQAIIFSRTGRMLNGQHRMLAIVKSGVGQWMLIAYNVEDSAVSLIDDGAPHTLSDVLIIEGWAPWEARTGATAARYAIAFAAGLAKLNVSCANHAGRDFIFDNPALMTSVEFLSRLSRIPTPMPHSLGALLHFEFSKIDSAAADQFIQKLWNGEDLPAGDIVLELRNRLLGRSLSGAKMNNDLLACATIRVWNSIRRGRPIKHINNAFRNDGTYPRPE